VLNASVDAGGLVNWWSTLNPTQAALAAELRAALTDLGVFLLILTVPSREESAADRGPSPAVLAFSTALRAPVHGGVAAFRDHESPSACWIRGEGHFTQTGSDAFGAWAADVLAALPQSRVNATRNP